MTFDIELDRQVVQAGDELIGWITLAGESADEVTIAFRGEETLGANSYRLRHVQPVADEVLTLDAKDGLDRQEFRIKVPDEAPPTYASRNLRCEYHLEASIDRGSWMRNRVKRLYVTVLPALVEDLNPTPEELEVNHPEISLLARLDQNVILTGDSLSGTLQFEKKKDDAHLPVRMSFRLAAIEESLDPSFAHREVLTLDAKDIEIDQELELPFQGYFEFPIESTAQPSGTWNLFKVHYGFRIAFYDEYDNDCRASTMIRVLRDMQPWERDKVEH